MILKNFLNNYYRRHRMNTIWVPIETPVLSGRWRANGTDQLDNNHWDEQVFDNKLDCLAHCEKLNRQQEEA